MTGKTHAAFGILLGTAYAINTSHDIGTSAVMIGTTGVFSLVPDICHSGSKIGREFKLLSRLINFFFGHRTLTHSLLFMAIIAVLMTLSNIELTYIICAMLGIASHILLDMMTPRGVALLFPLDYKVTLPLTFKTGGAMDLSLATTFSLLTAYLLYTEIFHRTLEWIHL
ncbi:metal-dependent hydrolase [Macrococcus equipercicus]|uniref:Metal-dependent hydrolase n=1 Tax=Macrococcus equipercicus TaxID=69967 RepID=A0A9Q9F1V6_9STAP|nr:metal-dependent hydrolase [Macrococcus equipercicus]KAA1037642.1 metal-dependent hydrolase [Macrococcus equipercicus]UTH14155.1 metal-dependent hydrolase [Macrococcus equipercicus]